MNLLFDQFTYSYFNFIFFIIFSFLIISIISINLNLYFINRYVKLFILIFDYTINTIKDNFFLIIFSSIIFFIMIFINLHGFFIYTHPFSSMPLFCLFTSFSIVFFCFIIGFKFHGLNYFSIFLPNNVPYFMILLIILIEIISYFIRCLSLGFRLSINILAGHLLLFLFSVNLLNIILQFNSPLLILYIILFFWLILLEVCVVFIQSYVFYLLTIIYIKDTFELH